MGKDSISENKKKSANENKLDLPDCWDKVCQDLNLPDNFNIWYHLFQKLVTARAESLIATIVAKSLNDVKAEIKTSLVTRVGKNEIDLRWYTWTEDVEDVSKSENNHTGELRIKKTTKI